MRRVLVTGATGYIGSNLARRLVNLNETVGILKRPSSKCDRLNDIIKKLTIYNYDGSIESINRAIKEFCPEVVFHLASFVIPRHKVEDIENLISSNVLFGTQILDVMRVNGVSKIVNASTYWQSIEALNNGPITLYTALKQAFEYILHFYANVYDVQSISLRLPDTYGPNDSRSKVLNLVHKAVKSNETLKMSAGEQEMDIIYIDDVVDGFILASDLFKSVVERFNIYSLSSRKPISLRKIVETYEKVNRVTVNIEWGALSYRENEIMKVIVPDNILPSWKQKIQLEEGLRRMVNFANVPDHDLIVKSLIN